MPVIYDYGIVTNQLLPYAGEGMDEMEFTEAESNMNDLVSEYQQYQACPQSICTSHAVFSFML